jgi:uncharacterized protein
MPIIVNLRHLDDHNLQLKGELPVAELDFDARDDVVRVQHPLQYDLEVQKVEDGLLVQGRLDLKLDCQCVRCLKNFQTPLHLDRWTTLVPLQGEEAVALINDCVDLTPTVREDILLEFPQHPLCKPDCGGLLKSSVSNLTNNGGAGQTVTGSPAWAELNKLKL